MTDPMRDYQEEALADIREAFRSGLRRIMLQMPTGAGKTRLAAEIVNGASGKKKKVAFVVPAISLIDQTVDMFHREGIHDVGVIQAKHKMTDKTKPIQICSIQTLTKRDLPEVDVVIRDEAHKLFKLDVHWMGHEAWKNVPFIGLSATPWTKGLGRYYQRLIIGATLQSLIDSGHLVPFRVFAPTHPDLSKVRMSMGDYAENDLAKAMNKEKLTADIVNTWLDKGRGRPTVLFAVDCLHAQTLQQRFEAAGVPTSYIDANTKLPDREKIKQQFENGEVDVVCNVDVMGIGVDWPLIGCISYCRPTRSEMRFVQNIGRGLRKANGKTDLLVLDHSDTTLRLGFVTDIVHDALDNGREAVRGGEYQAPLPKECPKCAFLKPKYALVCPNCGWKPTPAQVVQEAQGELEELSKEDTYGYNMRVAQKTTSIEDKARFLAELKSYARQRGFKEGWAFFKYQEKFGCQPASTISKVAPTRYPSSATMQWIKSRQIAWAKSKYNPRNKNAPVQGFSTGTEADVP